MGCFGGASGAETAINNTQQTFANDLMSAFNTQFANQSSVLSQLNSTLSPTVAAGPSQQGWSPAEAAAINSQTINQNAANFQQHAKQAATNAAGENNTSGLQSGITQAINAGISSNAAQNLSSEELSNTEANYAQGNANYQAAVKGMQTLAGQDYNPAEFANLASNANNTAFGQQAMITNQNNQKAGAIGGAIGAGISALSGGIGNLDTTGSSSTGEQFQNFLSGM